MVADTSSVLIEGPWEHRRVSANSQSFHVALAGDDGAPLVVLLHDYPQFWWAWRHQIPALAEAGYRVAAMDLRGFGASDKTPRTLATPRFCFDAAGVISALGYGQAAVVGHGIGGQVAWAMPAFCPEVTRAVVTLASPLILDMHRRSLPPATLAWLTGLFTPILAERAHTRGHIVRDVLERGSVQDLGPVVGRYTDAMRLPFAARCAIEHFRWYMGVHNEIGWFRRRIKRMAPVPTLALYGEKDPFMPPRLFARAEYRTVCVPDAGHFLPEERPDFVSRTLVSFLDSLDS